MKINPNNVDHTFWLLCITILKAKANNAPIKTYDDLYRLLDEDEGEMETFLEDFGFQGPIMELKPQVNQWLARYQPLLKWDNFRLKDNALSILAECDKKQIIVPPKPKPIDQDCLGEYENDWGLDDTHSLSLRMAYGLYVLYLIEANTEIAIAIQIPKTENMELLQVDEAIWDSLEEFGIDKDDLGGSPSVEAVCKSLNLTLMNQGSTMYGHTDPTPKISDNRIAEFDENTDFDQLNFIIRFANRLAQRVKMLEEEVNQLKDQIGDSIRDFPLK